MTAFIMFVINCNLSELTILWKIYSQYIAFFSQFKMFVLYKTMPIFQNKEIIICCINNCWHKKLFIIKYIVFNIFSLYLTFTRITFRK